MKLENMILKLEDNHDIKVIVDVVISEKHKLYVNTFNALYSCINKRRIREILDYKQKEKRIKYNILIEYIILKDWIDIIKSYKNDCLLDLYKTYLLVKINRPRIKDLIKIL
jgi:hypothetical protein